MFQVQDSGVGTNCSVKKLDYKADQASGFQVIFLEQFSTVLNVFSKLEHLPQTLKANFQFRAVSLEHRSETIVLEI